MDWLDDLITTLIHQENNFQLYHGDNYNLEIRVLIQVSASWLRQISLKNSPWKDRLWSIDMPLNTPIYVVGKTDVG